MNLTLNIRFWEYEFFAPYWLFLLLLVPIVFYILWRAEKHKQGEWKYTGTVANQRTFASQFVHILRKALIVLSCLVLAFLIFAMAKPYNWNDNNQRTTNYKNGIDIILALDISKSMLEQDFIPNRISVSRKIAKEFVDLQKGNRIGLVAFAAEAYTACPATTDYEALKKQIDKLNCFENIEGGTAIGTGLGTAVTRLRNDSLKSKVVILLTDGENNAGTISPQEATELAIAKQVRVYTIAVGSNQGDVVNIQTPFGIIQQKTGTSIDFTDLKHIASKTGGNYFHAKNEESLRKIYDEINQMEKRKIIESHNQPEPPAIPDDFLMAGLIFMLVAWATPRFLFMQND